jgi:hypothetical protein
MKMSQTFNLLDFCHMDTEKRKPCQRLQSMETSGGDKKDAAVPCRFWWT